MSQQNVTVEILRQLGAREDVISEFVQTFIAKRSVDSYLQPVLDWLCEEDKEELACKLLAHMGPTDDVFTGEILNHAGHFIFAGAIVVDGEIAATGTLAAGRYIQGGEAIAAGFISAGEHISARDTICSLSTLEAKGDITSFSEVVMAAFDIITSGSIRAHEGVRAGGNILAGGDIDPGKYGIFAGVNVSLEDWKTQAQVSARTHPRNLVSGCWVPAADSADSDVSIIELAAPAKEGGQ